RGARRPLLPRARAARDLRRRGARADQRARRGAQAQRDARDDPPGGALDGGRGHRGGAGRAGRAGSGARAAPRRWRDLTDGEGASMAYRLGVDVGGTFTDLFLVDDGDHRQWRVKTPSTPADPSQGVLTGVRRICEEAGIEPGALANV